MPDVCALAIGGLDPGGGAGIVADLRAFHAAGVFGCAVVALATVQSTEGLRSSVAVDAKLVVKQADEVVRAQRVGAIKVGALGSLENVRAVARWLARRVDVPVVLDPVMAPTRGRSVLLTRHALDAMREELLPCATLVTANAAEAALLTGRRVRTVAEASRAAEQLAAMGARAALVKGGHLAAGEDAVDVLFVEGSWIELRSKRLDLPATHGGGCVLASLIAGHLAKRSPFAIVPHVEAAVRSARRVHQRALRHAADVGGAMRVLVP
jgi:hydroxymethylpyrimidine/phosphomethylpyrimidine kinase